MICVFLFRLAWPVEWWWVKRPVRIKMDPITNVCSQFFVELRPFRRNARQTGTVFHFCVYTQIRCELCSTVFFYGFSLSLARHRLMSCRNTTLTHIASMELRLVTVAHNNIMRHNKNSDRENGYNEIRKNQRRKPFLDMVNGKWMNKLNFSMMTVCEVPLCISISCLRRRALLMRNLDEKR